MATKTLNRPLTIGLLAATLLLVKGNALAWGKTGHRITGAIAELHLSGYARAQIALILGNETLAEASIWPDFMRSNPSQFWQVTAGPWHYVTVPPGKNYEETGAPPQGDAVTALNRFTHILQDPDASLENKQLSLRFLIHIIGDLHQPLHAGNGKDRGGNDFGVSYAGQRTNLHWVWDEGLIASEKLSFTEWVDLLEPQITPERVVSWWDSNPQTWIAESAALRDNIYPEERDLRWAYSYQHIDTVRTQLSKAGIRTAAYLNNLFSP
ncbi:MAG: S1/P1 nuclease [Pseudomonadota bacterium]